MFKYSSSTLINGTTYVDGTPAWFSVNGGAITYSDQDAAEANDLPVETSNTEEVSFTVNRNGKFFPDAVTSITKAKWVDPKKDVLTVDFSALDEDVAGDGGNFRLFLYIKSVENADPLYATAYKHKGRPLFIEFKSCKGDDAAKMAERLAKAASKWLTLFDQGSIVKVSVDGAVVTIKATSEFQRFAVCELQKFDPEVEVWAHDGKFVTLYSSDENSDLYNEELFQLEKGNVGFGTHKYMVENVRLQTNANLRLYRNQVDEVPVPGTKYWQYVITQCVERPEMRGQSVLGQYNKSVTSHVFFVADAVQEQFEADLAVLGVDVEEVENVAHNA